MTSGELSPHLLRDSGEAAPLLPDAAGHLPEAARSAETDGHGDVVVGVSDSRLAVVYLTAPGSDEYIAVMDVLEASVTYMTPAEVVVALAAAGSPMDEKVVVARLDKLRGVRDARHGTPIGAADGAGGG